MGPGGRAGGKKGGLVDVQSWVANVSGTLPTFNSRKSLEEKDGSDPLKEAVRKDHAKYKEMSFSEG